MPNPRLLDWIIQNFFEVPPLLDDHQTEQTRVANPLLNWLRNVALLVEKKLKLQEWLRSSEIAASSSPRVSSADDKKARGDATSAVGASGNGEKLPPPGRAVLRQRLKDWKRLRNRRTRDSRLRWRAGIVFGFRIRRISGLN
jgi:hypothetical protein